MSTVAAEPTAQERIDVLVGEFIPDHGDFVASIIAEKVLAYLSESEPDLLNRWLYESAASFLTDRVRYRSAALRAVATRRQKNRTFHEVATRAVNGDSEALGSFRVDFVVDDRNTRRRVADMTGADHKFVAARYQRDGARDLMIASFHEAVAKKVGKKRTADVMSEAQYESLLESFTNRSA